MAGRVTGKYTFAAGNAQALRRVPLYLLGAIATLVVPRTSRIWVFGCGIGPGEGVLPLLRAASERLGPETRLVWLATTEDELARARALGLDAVAKLSVRGFWLTLRARVQVVTHGQGDVNRYAARGGLLVQLWHGIPLKRLHLDSPAALTAPSPISRLVVQVGHRAVGRQVSIFVVASERVVGRFCSAFGLRREQVLVAGDPRDDVLLRGSADERRAAARARLEAAVGPLAAGPVVMYAPTWREGGADPAQPDDTAWRQIAGWLDRVDGTLLVRNHPLGHGDYATGAALTRRVRLLDTAVLAEVTPVLPAIDILVTDYSSMAFDFALVDGPVVYLAADIDTYVDSRGLYDPYPTFSGGRHVATWAHALAQLDDLVRGDSQAQGVARAHARWLRDEYFDYLDGRATERVLDAILARLAGERLAPPPPLERSRAQVTGTRLEPDRLVVQLRADVLESATLAGPREDVAGEVRPGVDGITVEFALLVARWGRSGLALPSGDYRLTLTTGGAAPSTRVHVAAAALTGLRTDRFRAELRADGGGFVVRIAPPLADDERGRAAQLGLQLRYLLPVRRLENAVFLESFYGRSASDNPLGVDRALARRNPDVRRYWSVRDRSVAVPPGAVPVVEYSREWWRVRAAARLYVVNDWLRWTHRRRRGQRVLQTWHGTALKRLALDRAHHTPRQKLAVVRQSRKWDAMLVQNEYSAERFRSSYAFGGPMWATGYPRNDELRDASRAAGIRAAIRVPADARLVLYAPTWRDDRVEIVDHLDLAEFALRLPADHVLLVRGHTRTLENGPDLTAAGLVDVTSYPDVADLMLVADVLVTDYSSVMFDFAATGKPMIFYTPDLDHYSDVLRGFYFDLLAEAPGPVVTAADELAAAVSAEPDDKYAERYAAWRARFTPYDDGRAGERVVERLYDEGWLG